MPERSVKYLIIGGGIAAGGCVKQLRDDKAEGSILLVAREPAHPYHRPPLTKEYMRDEQSREEVFFEQQAWYEENDVDVLTDTEVTTIDPTNRTATLSDGSTVKYEKALLATGSKVRELPVEGIDLEGIHYLRRLSDCESIKKEAEGAKHVALVGGSFIATELAASLTALGKECELIMLEEEPLERFFGSEMGKYFGDILTEHGVKLHRSQEVDHFEGKDGRVSGVVTKSGLKVECDFVVVGAGVVPDIELAKAAGLETKAGVITNEFLETSAPGIYAAGDIAEYQSIIHERRMRIEHWDVAINHGITAAQNMLGQQKPYETVPYFWSDLADWSSMETDGPAMKWDEIWWRGRPVDKEFTAWYVKGNRLVGALSVGRSDDIEIAKKLLSDKTDISSMREALQDPAAMSLP